MKNKVLLSIVAIMLLVTSIFVFTACGDETPTTITSVSIATPGGAPMIALYDIINNQKINDNLSATVTIESDPTNIGTYVGGHKTDFVVLPSNLAFKLYMEQTNKHDSETYKFVCTTTYGNIHLVGGKNSEVVTSLDQLKGKIVYSFNGAIAEQVLKAIIGPTNYDDMVNTEITSEQDTIIPDKINLIKVTMDEAVSKVKGESDKYAIIAEPKVTAATTKNEKNPTPAIRMLDFQSLYQAKYNTENKGYPQAVLVVKNSLYTSHPEIVKQVKEAVEASATNANQQTVVQIGNFKFPKPAVMGSNIKVLDSTKAKDDVKLFIKNIMNEDVPDSFFI